MGVRLPQSPSCCHGRPASVKIRRVTVATRPLLPWVFYEMPAEGEGADVASLLRDRMSCKAVPSEAAPAGFTCRHKRHRVLYLDGVNTHAAERFCGFRETGEQRGHRRNRHRSRTLQLLGITGKNLRSLQSGVRNSGTALLTLGRLLVAGGSAPKCCCACVTTDEVTSRLLVIRDLILVILVTRGRPARPRTSPHLACSSGPLCTTTTRFIHWKPV